MRVFGLMDTRACAHDPSTDGIVPQLEELSTVHYRSKSSHYTPTATDVELRNQAKLGDYLCNQIDVWREKQGLPPHKTLKTNSRKRGLQQFINDEVAKGLAPLVANIPKMVADALKTSAPAPAVANSSDSAIKAMSAHSGIAGDDFHARANARKRSSDAYIRRNPIKRERVTTNSDDPAVRAMSGNDMVAFIQGRAKS
jgi:hypothetical protein